MAVDTKFIGKKYPPTTYEVGREKIKEYARAIGDMNPLYFDEEKAKETKYGGVIAPPTFAVVYGGEPVGKVLMDKELALNLMMLVHGEQDFEFGEVVRPGDVITTDCEIADILEKKGKSFVTAITESRNQKGEMVVRGKWLFVIRG
ncbi:MaoC family dehydratase N-terminal domain-containing protein [bacterium]